MLAAAAAAAREEEQPPANAVAASSKRLLSRFRSSVTRPSENGKTRHSSANSLGAFSKVSSREGPYLSSESQT